MTRLSQASRGEPTTTIPRDGDIGRMVEIVNVVLRSRRTIIWAAVIGGVLTGGLVLLSPRSYTASAAFIPQTRRPSSAIAGLASQFNLAIPTGDATQSPAFYAEVLGSRQLLGAVAEGPFTYERNGRMSSGPLTEALQIKGHSGAERREAAIDRLAAITSSSVGARTGVIHISASAQSPGLALEIARRLLTALEEFNLGTRRTQARAERQFTEQRVSEARSDLRAAEDRLEEFLQRNRDSRGSPTLTFDRDRLQNELTMRQQLYSSVTQAYEQARVEEVRDTPLITVIESPTLPAKPDPRGLARKIILAGILASLLTVGFLLARNLVRSQTALDLSESLAENRRLRDELAWELRRPWRLVFPTRGRPSANTA
ncbi:MAG: lipopolysaccharide biosynthesis protein [Gemmatimonadales bacterium]|nr:lipopolysaccharide biosynthesis protein [Gemmatimonadales bacterium]